MKKLISLLLAMTLAATCALPAGAVDDEEAEASPAPVTVTTAEELLEAIEAAEDGDTILIGATICPAFGTTIGSSEKRITLARANEFRNSIMFSCIFSAAFENLTFDGSGSDVQCLTIFADVHFYGVTVQNTNTSGIVVASGNPAFEDCTFENNSASKGGHLLIKSRAGATIRNSSFFNGASTMQGGGAISNSGDLNITDCTFIGNATTGNGGAISTSGRCRIEGCTIIGNSASAAGGGIHCVGSLEISDSVIYGNTAQMRGADIASSGELELSISGDDLSEVYQIEGRMPLGFYCDASDGRFNGETNVTENKPLPISKESGVLDLIFVFTDEIIVQDDEQQVEPVQEPDQQEPEEPAQPSEPEAPQGQEQPEEPAQEPTSEPEPEPEQPSASVAPPSVVPPSYTPSRSNTRSSEDSDTSESESEPAPAPAEQAQPEAAAPALSCGGAALDTSGRAFLAGYGDGVIGEDDPVTRAQIAQIIYRLMTDESREALQTTENSFEDVPAEAWYNLAVSTIARAGIVVGTGDGFHPEGYITRAQLITIMARFIAPAEQESSYADVTGHWAESFIGTAEAAGWLTGGGDLRPNEYISRREVVEFINHVFDLCEEAA